MLIVINHPLHTYVWFDLFLLLSLSTAISRARFHFWMCTAERQPEAHSNSLRSLHVAMKHLSAEAKHPILLEYASHDSSRSFAALARRHAVKGGREAVRQWHRRWDGTSASLQEKPRSGRPRRLSRAAVQQHVQRPILAANRAHRALSYTKLLPQVRERARTQVSLRTLQRYGKEETGARGAATKKRTRDECECNATA